MHMSTFSLKIIASDKVFFDGEATVIILPAMDGEKAILANHENMAIAVNVGVMKLKLEDNTWIQAVVGRGFAEIIDNVVTILVDTAERPEDIDAARARDALDRAEEQLRQKQSVQEYQHTQASLARAMNRLKVIKEIK